MTITLTDASGAAIVLRVRATPPIAIRCDRYPIALFGTFVPA